MLVVVVAAFVVVVRCIMRSDGRLHARQLRNVRLVEGRAVAGGGSVHHGVAASSIIHSPATSAAPHDGGRVVLVVVLVVVRTAIAVPSSAAIQVVVVIAAPVAAPAASVRHTAAFVSRQRPLRVGRSPQKAMARSVIADVPTPHVRQTARAERPHAVATDSGSSVAGGLPGLYSVTSAVVGAA